MRKKTDLRFALDNCTFQYSLWTRKRYPRLILVAAMCPLSVDHVMNWKVWDISVGQYVIAMLQKAARHSRGLEELWEEVRKQITSRYRRKILGSFRFDYGYENEYNYKILQLKISYCKLDNILFFDTICLENSR